MSAYRDTIMISRYTVLIVSQCSSGRSQSVVDQRGRIGALVNQAPALHPVIGIGDNLVRVRRGFCITQTRQVKIVWRQTAIAGQCGGMTRIIDEIVEVLAFIGVQQVDGFTHRPI